jgi:hypothetical protein
VALLFSAASVPELLQMGHVSGLQTTLHSSILQLQDSPVHAAIFLSLCARFDKCSDNIADMKLCLAAKLTKDPDEARKKLNDVRSINMT